MYEKEIGKALEAIDRYEAGNKEDAKRILYEYLSEYRHTDGASSDIFSLLMELYIFICDGDLRQYGRDTGFASTKEVREALAAFICKGS